MSKMPPGKRVRESREALGLTREELAAKCGVSTSTIARLELWDRLPRVGALSTIAACLGLSIAEVLGERVASEAPSAANTA